MGCLVRAELELFASEKGIRKEAVTAFIKQKKVFVNRAANGSGYGWHWNFQKKFKKRLNAAHLAFLTAKVATRTLACLIMPCLAHIHFQSIYFRQHMTTGACDTQGEALDFPGLSADLFQLHAHLQPQLTQEELNTAVQHYSAKIESVVRAHDLHSFWSILNGERLLLCLATWSNVLHHSSNHCCALDALQLCQALASGRLLEGHPRHARIQLASQLLRMDMRRSAHPQVTSAC